MKYIKILVISALLLVQNAYAADEFLLSMQQEYKKINAFTADFTQELFHRESQHRQNKSGNFAFKKDLNIYFNVKSPSPELLIANNKEVWNYFPNEEIAYKYSSSLVQGSKNILSVITGQAALDEEFEVEKAQDVKIGGNMLACYTIYPFEPSVEMTEAKIFVNKETKLIEAVQVFDFAGNTNYIVFNNFVINPKLNNSLFTFQVPKNVDVEDQSNIESLMLNSGR